MELASPGNYSVETGPAWVEMAQGPTQHGIPIYLYMTEQTLEHASTLPRGLCPRSHLLEDT